jgi:uncharacterized protein
VIRVVIDTNVLVSALISAEGNEALVLLAIHHGLVMPCFSGEIMEEYSGVMRRPKFRFSSPEIEAMLELVRRRGTAIEGAPKYGLSPDPGDDKFIACVLASGAEFLVTGNKRHFPEEHMGRARVVSAKEFIEFVVLGLERGT